MNKEHRMKRLVEMSSLEREWAQRIIGGENYSDIISDFPYFNNYTLLIQKEWNSLNACCLHKKHEDVLFIGGGPFPLSAILLAKQYQVNITVLDNDPSAVDTSKKLIQKMKLEKQINIIQASAEDFYHYEQFQIVILASMVGMDEQEKLNIMNHIKSQIKPGTHILARTSKSKLYPKISKEATKGLTPIMHIEPKNGVKNTFLILKK